MDGFPSSESSPRQPFAVVLNPVFKSHGAHKQSGVAFSITDPRQRAACALLPPPMPPPTVSLPFRSSLAIDRSPAQLRTRRSRRLASSRGYIHVPVRDYRMLPHSPAPRPSRTIVPTLDRSIDAPLPSPPRIDCPSLSRSSVNTATFGHSLNFRSSVAEKPRVT